MIQGKQDIMELPRQAGPLSRVPEDVIMARNGSVLGKRTVIKSDHFPGCQNKRVLPHVEGAPNFRQIDGLPVYGVAIPTVEGIRNVLHMVGASKEGGRRVLWHNMREEPVVYINGRPFVLREVERPFSNLEYTGIDRARVEQMEARLKQDILAEAARYSNKIMVSDELPDGQMVDQWEPIGPDSVRTPLEVYQGLQEEGYLVEYERVPVTDEKSPKERDFDLLVEKLAVVHDDTAQIFNCQMGRGRTTTGTVVATLVALRLRNLNTPAAADTLAPPPQPAAPAAEAAARGGGKGAAGAGSEEAEEAAAEEALRHGEYVVIRSLTRVLEGGMESKRLVDRVIDRCAAMQNLREAILGYRNAIHRQADEKKRQAALTNFVEYLERYYFLICFAAFLHGKSEHLRLLLQQAKDRGASIPQKPAAGAVVAAAARGLFQGWMKARPELYSILRRLLRRDPMGALGYRRRQVVTENPATGGIPSTSALLLQAAAAAAAPSGGVAHEDGESEAEEKMLAVVASRQGAVLGRQTMLKSDHCPGCQNMGLLEHIEGAPNFREVPGFHVYGVANPTVDGIRAVLTRMGCHAGSSDGSAGGGGGRRVVWHNMREEATVYINGKPFVLREAERPFKNMREYEGINRERVEAMEARLREDVVQEARRNMGAVVVNHESEDGQVFHALETVVPPQPNGTLPLPIEADEATVRSPLQVFKALQAEGYAVDYYRLPITDGKAPKSRDLDAIATRIGACDPDTAFVFNCQMGRGRTTTGTVIATLVLTRCLYGRPLRPPTFLSRSTSARRPPSDDGSGESDEEREEEEEECEESSPGGPGKRDEGKLTESGHPDGGHDEDIGKEEEQAGMQGMKAVAEGDNAQGAGPQQVSREDGGAVKEPPESAAPVPPKAAKSRFLVSSFDSHGFEFGSGRVGAAARVQMGLPPLVSEGDREGSKPLARVSEEGSRSGKRQRVKEVDLFSMEDIPVVRKITRLLADGAACRQVLDAVINGCDAMQNIRAAVLRYRKTFNLQEMSARVRQSALSRGAEYLERYILLIAFTAYLNSRYFVPTGSWPAAAAARGGTASATGAVAAEAAASSDSTMAGGGVGAATAVVAAAGEDASEPKVASPVGNGAAVEKEPGQQQQQQQMTFKAWLKRRPEIKQMKWSIRLRPARLFTIPEVEPPRTSTGKNDRGADPEDEVMEAVVRARVGSVLGRGSILKLYHFPGLLSPTLQAPWLGERSDLVPNFFQVPGYPVHSMATPSTAGAKAVLSHLGAVQHSHRSKPGNATAAPAPTAAAVNGEAPPLVKCSNSSFREGQAATLPAAAVSASASTPCEVRIVDLREEAVVYIHGQPFVLRELQQPVGPLKNVGIEGRMVEKMERRMKDDILAEAERMGGHVLLHKEEEVEPGREEGDGEEENAEEGRELGDGANARKGEGEGVQSRKGSPVRGGGEKPMELVGFWQSVTPADVLTPSEVYERLRDKEGFSLTYARIPTTRERWPKTADVDEIQKCMQGSSPCVKFLFVSHTGYGAISYAMAVACLRLRTQVAAAPLSTCPDCDLASPLIKSAAASSSFSSSSRMQHHHHHFHSLQSPVSVNETRPASTSKQARTFQQQEKGKGWVNGPSSAGEGSERSPSSIIPPFLVPSPREDADECHSPKGLSPAEGKPASQTEVHTPPSPASSIRGVRLFPEGAREQTNVSLDSPDIQRPGECKPISLDPAQPSSEPQPDPLKDEKSRKTGVSAEISSAPSSSAAPSPPPATPTVGPAAAAAAVPAGVPSAAAGPSGVRGKVEEREAALMRGEYRNVMSLVRILVHGPVCKEEVDAIASRLVAVGRIRGDVLEYKMKMEAMSGEGALEKEQRAVMEEMAIKALRRYCFLIVFRAYLFAQAARDQQDGSCGAAQPGAQGEKWEKFADWVKNRPEIGHLCQHLVLE